MPKTDDEVEDLKKQWQRDPNWDLASTEGFEAFGDQLREFARISKADLEREWQAYLRGYAASIGLGANLRLAEHIIKLQVQIDELIQELQRMKQA